MDYALLFFLKIVIGLFFSILFLQSGLDKVFDFNGNKGYIRSVFEKTFLKNLSPLLFISILILEVTAGAFSLAGTINFFLTENPNLLILGLNLSASSLLCLFLGQRIAKDYAGAGGLVPYIIVSLLSMALFSFSGPVVAP